MTRINCIPATLLLDEHLIAAHREGLRPQNELLQGKDNTHKAPVSYQLKTGHVLFCRKHLLWTNRQFEQARAECISRGINIQLYHSSTTGIPSHCLNDYQPTVKDYRHNLARICERFRKRKKAYHFKGQKVDSVKDFRLYLKTVNQSLNINHKE